jgi:hypothetical protein
MRCNSLFCDRVPEETPRPALRWCRIACTGSDLAHKSLQVIKERLRRPRGQ